MNNMTDIPILVKIFGVIIGAIFALTLTGDIDQQGKLRLNMGVMVKVAFSAYFGFLSGGWLIEYMDWQRYSYVSHGFVMMLCSVFGMALVGVIYQSFKLSTTDKTFSEIIQEIKETFRSIIK
ncbi:hypothetical protein [Moraxella sp. ZY200743]|uniref:hypothetical protein n=1 Tax=Moraxella sp. ZY200743 TaxID=2911970 RepID=UPI003D7E2AEF